MCRAGNEIINHLLVHCPFSKEVWAEALALTTNSGSWQDTTVEESLKQWMEDESDWDCTGLPRVVSVACQKGHVIS